VTPVAKRVMALLVGLHHQEGKRKDRAEIAQAVKRSQRTVIRALYELQSYGWIEVRGGGHGTPGTIRVINDKAWIMARVSRNGTGLAEDGTGFAQNGTGLARIRVKEVILRKHTQHPQDDADLTPFEESVREASGLGRLSSGDRRYLRELREGGTPEAIIRAGVVLGRARKIATGSPEPIRALKYFAGTIAEAAGLQPEYLAHVEQRLGYFLRHERKPAASEGLFLVATAGHP
jgi:hypothetical protein